jgi:hypothetical protein
MRARISDERSNELQRRRLLRRTSAHNPVPVFIGEHRKVLHRLHISPTGQRFRRAWDVDVPPGTLSAVLEALTIACQLVCVFDSGRAPCQRDGRNQTNRQDARISHRQLALSRIRGCPAFRSKSGFAVERINEPRFILKFSSSCADTGMLGSRASVNRSLQARR